jgi:Glu-tRNA(Gln) amidotransferase subunit E-like FAD-binding protein
VPIDVRAYDEMKKKVTNPDDVLKWLEKETGNKQLSEQLLWSSYLPLFREILEKTKVSGAVVAPILLERTKEIKRAGGDIDRISNGAFVHLFEVYKSGGITKAGMGEALKQIPEDADAVDAAIKSKSLGRISGAELDAVIRKMGKKGKEEILRELMAKYRLNVDGEELNKYLNTLIK